MNLLKKIINKILSKFNIPRMDISDKEYDENFKKFCDRLETAKKEEFVVPLLNKKEMEILEKEIKKHIKVNNENLNIKIGGD